MKSSQNINIGLDHTNAELRLLTIREVTDLLQISHVTLNRLSKKGDFPRPVRVSRQVRYRATEVREWIQKNQH